MAGPQRRLNSRQIEVFRTVMVSGSLSAASRELGVAQPSLSRLIRRVEDIVGFALFTRAVGRLLPTPEAHRLFASVEHIQAQIEGLASVVDQIGRGGAGLFRLGASPSLARQLVPNVLADLRTRFTDLRLQLDVVTLAGIADYLALGIGECFVSMTPIHSPGVTCNLAGPGRLAVLVPSGHELAGRPTLEAADLVGRPLVMCEAGSPHEQLVQALFAEIGATPTSSITVRFAELAIGMVAAGLGLAVVDEFTALGVVAEGVVVRPVPGRARFQVHVSRSDMHPVSRFGSGFEAALRLRLSHAMKA